jgi:hypothetical protein
MNDTPTPRTDEAWAAWKYLGSGMSVHVGRELERELTAAREELAELKEEYGTWWAQKRIAIDELKEVTEQRDRLAEALSYLASCGYDGPLPQYARDKAFLALATLTK